MFAKTRVSMAALHPLVLGVLDRVLGHYQLSAPTGIRSDQARRPRTSTATTSIYPLPRLRRRGGREHDVAIDDFTEANGATRVVPGSHRWTTGGPAPTT